MNNKTGQRILLVEDEVSLAEILRDYLIADHFQVEIRHDGNGIIELVQQSKPDLVLLDLMLPGVDGLTLCREIRKFSEVPIIIVTAKIDEIDRLIGLELGADDYICKPAKPREVIARIKAVLRRTGLTAKSWLASSPIQLDADRQLVTINGRKLNLTRVEFRLLMTLAESPGRILSREQLLNAAYDDGRIVGDRVIDTHIRNLRHKMKPLLGEQVLIHSVYGSGYKLDWGSS